MLGYVRPSVGISEERIQEKTSVYSRESLISALIRLLQWKPSAPASLQFTTAPVNHTVPEQRAHLADRIVCVRVCVLGASVFMCVFIDQG